jgi:hypothetical protein
MDKFDFKRNKLVYDKKRLSCGGKTGGEVGI